MLLERRLELAKERLYYARERSPGAPTITVRIAKPLGYMIVHEDGRTYYVQSDWEFPHIARTFGARIREDISYSRQIAAAIRWLDAISGDEEMAVEDPGYFL